MKLRRSTDFGLGLNESFKQWDKTTFPDVNVGDSIKVERQNGVFVPAKITDIKGSLISYEASNGDSGSLQYDDQRLQLNTSTKELKESIEATYVRDDDWSNGLYKGTDGNMYVEVDGVLHTMTDEGEPLAPARNVKVKAGEPTGFGKNKKIKESSNDMTHADVVNKTFEADTDGAIEIYSGSDARSADVVKGDKFISTEKKYGSDHKLIGYLGHMSIKGYFKHVPGLSGKNFKPHKVGHEEVVFLLRQTNIDGKSDYFAHFSEVQNESYKDHYKKGDTVQITSNEQELTDHEIYDSEAKSLIGKKVTIENVRFFGKNDEYASYDVKLSNGKIIEDISSDVISKKIEESEINEDHEWKVTINIASEWDLMNDADVKDEDQLEKVRVAVVRKLKSYSDKIKEKLGKEVVEQYNSIVGKLAETKNAKEFHDRMHKLYNLADDSDIYIKASESASTSGEVVNEAKAKYAFNVRDMTELRLTKKKNIALLMTRLMPLVMYAKKHGLKLEDNKEDGYGAKYVTGDDAKIMDMFKVFGGAGIQLESEVSEGFGTRVAVNDLDNADLVRSKFMTALEEGGFQEDLAKKAKEEVGGVMFNFDTLEVETDGAVERIAKILRSDVETVASMIGWQILTVMKDAKVLETNELTPEEEAYYDRCVRWFDSFPKRITKNTSNKVPSVAELQKLFNKVNIEARKFGNEKPVPLTDWEYYSTQIQNLYGTDEKKADELAKQLTK